jgi:hypothetical protein
MTLRSGATYWRLLNTIENDQVVSGNLLKLYGNVYASRCSDTCGLLQRSRREAHAKRVYQNNMIAAARGRVSYRSINFRARIIFPSVTAGLPTPAVPCMIGIRWPLFMHSSCASAVRGAPPQLVQFDYSTLILSLPLISPCSSRPPPLSSSHPLTTPYPPHPRANARI